MELRHARYVVAVAEELSFRKAAEKLHIAQPALSMQIKALEDDLGGKLFHRTSRKVELTKAGSLFVREARQLLRQAEKSVNVAKMAMRGQLGSVELGCTGSAAFSGLVGDIVRSWRMTVPGVEIKLREVDPQTLMADLLKGKIDAGFTTSLALQIPGSVAVEKMAAWPMMLAVSAAGALGGKKIVSRKVVRELPFVVYTGTPEDDGVEVIRQITGFSPRQTHQADNVMMVLALVGAGLGVALVPSALQPYTEPLGVSLKRLESLEVTMDCVLVYKKENLEPLLGEFISCVRATRSRSW